MMGDSHIGEGFAGPNESLRLKASVLQNYTWVTAYSLCHLYLPATALASLVKTLAKLYPEKKRCQL